MFRFNLLDVKDIQSIEFYIANGLLVHVRCYIADFFVGSRWATLYWCLMTKLEVVANTPQMWCLDGRTCDICGILTCNLVSAYAELV